MRRGASAKWIGTDASHGVPIGASEAEPLGHRLAGDHLAGVVVFE